MMIAIAVLAVAPQNLVHANRRNHGTRLGAVHANFATNAIATDRSCFAVLSLLLRRTASNGLLRMIPTKTVNNGGGVIVRR